MIDEKEIREAAVRDSCGDGEKGRKSHFYLGIDREQGFKAGANWAMEEMKKESIFSKMSTEKIEEMIERGEDERPL